MPNTPSETPKPTPSMPSSLALENGFAVVPVGLLATIETSLERTTPPNTDAFALPPGYAFVQPDPVNLDDFKKLYRAVGDPWLWFGRLQKSDEGIRSILTAPTTTLRYLLDPSGQPVGLAELRRENAESLEVSYFGLVPQATGKKLGPVLMEHGLSAAWTPQTTRAWLHTCTFDSPAALSFYRRQGFKPFRQRLELSPDPRLTGVLPRETAPQIPLADFSDP
ncbi:MAG: GNAT family N-acetyltransferase [Pseudomonadota bacterium]